MTVEVYSAAELVRLYLNDELIGEKLTGRDQQFKAEFEINYAPGTLKVQGLRHDRIVAESILQTAGAPVGLKISADRTALHADGQDLSFITVEAVDEKGRFQIKTNQKVHFSVSGAGTIAAVGNGDPQSLDSYSGHTMNLFNGRAMVILRTTREAGEIKLTANVDGLTTASIVLESKSPASSLPELR
jgi:beta-galactosidase